MDHLILRIMIRRARERRRRIQINLSRIEKAQLRDMLDPFAVTETEFCQYYRLPKVLARELIDSLEPYMHQPQRASAIPVYLKVLCALHFFANGNFQKPNERNYDLAMSQPSVSRAIDEVVNVMNRLDILQAHIRFPREYNERRLVIHKNSLASDLKCVIGYVDGTHIPIKRPTEREDIFVNRKGYHSINVQITCDTDLVILNVVAQFPGCTDDAYIWAGCSIRERMVAIYNEGRGESCWLLGDSGYPEEPWLHTPIPDAAEGSKERVYTEKHCSARNAVVRCIRILKGRFLCLSKIRALDYHHLKVSKMVNACCVLHNICVKARLSDPDPVPEEEELEDAGDDHVLDDVCDEEVVQEVDGGRSHRIRNLLREAQDIRQRYLIDCQEVPPCL
ncbi:putative nuclease HARBI1 [Frankliniella occidentalis]|uniref:Nuclease HARBI1 n=1 Tax=Frankliniella occidentalis TaxID=133901 RepID=A0A6J1SEQ7_FRAOC|nr:putative nuclease HARBI1 [Frankliniella occidentalis]